jgi:hypothetical protein
MMGGFRVSREKHAEDHDHREHEYDITLQPLDHANTPLRRRADPFPHDPRGMQHQLRSAIYRPILTVMTLARAAGWRPRCRRQGRNGRPTWVIWAACAVRPLRG